MMCLNLPYPLSNNRIYINVRNIPGGRMMSKDARRWIEETQARATAQGAKSRKLSGCRVCADVVIHPKAKKNGTPHKLTPDLDNCCKLLFDSLNGIAYDDDKQITDLRVRLSGEPKPNGGITLRLSETEFELT